MFVRLKVLYQQVISSVDDRLQQNITRKYYWSERFSSTISSPVHKNEHGRFTIIWSKCENSISHRSSKIYPCITAFPTKWHSWPNIKSITRHRWGTYSYTCHFLACYYRLATTIARFDSLLAYLLYQHRLNRNDLLIRTDSLVKVTYKCVGVLLSIVINLRLTSANIKMYTYSYA